MRRLGRFLLSTMVGGVLFLVPIVLLAVLLREAWQTTAKVIRPVASLIGRERLFGMVAEDLLAIVAIALVFFAAGLFVGTRRGRRWNQAMERTVLYRVPGYIALRSVAQSVPGLAAEPDFGPALLRTEEGWAFALIIERHPHGWYTVFIPDAPSPTSGAVRVVAASHVKPLDVPTLAMVGVLTKSGVGAGELVSHLLAADSPSDEPGDMSPVDTRHAVRSPPL